MAITHGIKIHFGIGYSTPLPAGWKLVESEEEFAFAVTPDGSEYFLGPDKAYPRRKFGTDGIPHGTKPGEHYIDMETGIIDLSNNELTDPKGSVG